MAEKGLPAPTPKLGRPKLLVQTKAKATLKPRKTNIPLEPKVILGPVDQQEGQNALYPPNQLAHLPDIPAQHSTISHQILKTHQTLQIHQTHQPLQNPIHKTQ